MFNSRMSKQRVAIEWCFGQIYNCFPYVHSHSKQHLEIAGPNFRLAALMTNVRTTLLQALRTKRPRARRVPRGGGGCVLKLPFNCPIFSSPLLAFSSS